MVARSISIQIIHNTQYIERPFCFRDILALELRVLDDIFTEI